MLCTITSLIVNDDVNSFGLSEVLRDTLLKDVAGNSHIVTNTRMLMRFLDTQAAPQSIRLMMLDFNLAHGTILTVLPGLRHHRALAPDATLIGWSSDPSREQDFQRAGANGFIVKTRKFELLTSDILAIVESQARGEWRSFV